MGKNIQLKYQLYCNVLFKFLSRNTMKITSLTPYIISEINEGQKRNKNNSIARSKSKTDAKRRWVITRVLWLLYKFLQLTRRAVEPSEHTFVDCYVTTERINGYEQSKASRQLLRLLHAEPNLGEGKPGESPKMWCCKIDSCWLLKREAKLHTDHYLHEGRLCNFFKCQQKPPF